MRQTTCPYCGGPVLHRYGRGGSPVYCSALCRGRAATQRKIADGRHAKRMAAQNDRRAAARALQAPTPRSCSYCGGPTVRRPGKRGPWPLYCSALCKGRAAHERAVANGNYAEWEATSAARRAAKRAAKLKPCPYCGILMDSPRRVQCGAPECQRQAVNERAREFHRDYKERTGTHIQYRFKQERECVQCGKRWVTATATAKFCSNACQAAYEYGPSRLPKSPQSRRRQAIRRVVKVAKGVRQAVYQRDGYRCQIPQCLFRDRRVDATRRTPHPKAPVLDHVIPIWEGRRLGLSDEEINAPANLRCAHFRCNAHRGAGGGNDQLALIG